MDWSMVAGIVFGSSVIAALISSFVGWRMKARAQKRYNCFIALTLAHIFENYAHDCMDVANEHDLYKSSRGAAGKAAGIPPELIKLPNENFRDFDLALLDEVFDFPLRVKFANGAVYFMADIGEHDDADDTAYEHNLLLAEKALSLADRLRSHYKLSSRELKIGEYDFRQQLSEKLAALHD